MEQKITSGAVAEFIFAPEPQQTFIFGNQPQGGGEENKEVGNFSFGASPTQVYREPPVIGALLDGEQVEIDANKNLILDLGLKQINDKLDNYLGNSTVTIFFRNNRFEQLGNKYELKIPMAEHKRGFGAIVEKVFEYINGDYKETFSQSYTMSDGSVIVATHRTFDGMIYIKGVNEYGK